MAARNCHLELEAKYLEVVKLLTEENPEFQHPPNKVEETPLYLAAERGDKGVTVVLALLETCTSPTYSGPEGRTALHVAALKDSTGLSQDSQPNSLNSLQSLVIKIESSISILEVLVSAAKLIAYRNREEDVLMASTNQEYKFSTNSSRYMDANDYRLAN
ncbi:hypothetical protein RHMOL_Rhmol04G0313500 [Rhododendron molle]|uniref:Uncharacterized protein n=1 Tax=Rhododendron molle TaxID=49168 RepID=A0ACC0P6F9_RHOML|nr:hypothetical protein RHMOL_Rhmol04G0313500 [Rhododendron molle]